MGAMPARVTISNYAMSGQIECYAAQKAKEPLSLWSFRAREMEPNDVELEIKYCGICHSDIHMCNDDWGQTLFPCVPGHEILGVVKSVGSEVTGFKPGDPAAIGCFTDSCGKCESCKSGNEHICPKRVLTYSAPTMDGKEITKGGYSTRIICRDKFVIRIAPKQLTPGAAPLLCAGLTTWEPLRMHKVGKGSQVAVAGLGGLGHMAIKLAKALGADVSLFSRSTKKMEDAKRLGVDNFVVSSDPEAMKAVIHKFDLVIDTIPVDHDINPYIETVKPFGFLSLVGFLGTLSTPINTIPMVQFSKGISGALVGGPSRARELLDFCDKHNVLADVEVIKADQVNKAFDRTVKGDVKYRFVIDNSSIGA